MPKYLNYGNKKFEVYEAEKRPSVWSRFKAGAKDIADKTLKAPQRQEEFIAVDKKSIPVSEYEKEIYNIERQKVLKQEATQRAIQRARQPQQHKSNGFMGFLKGTPEQQMKARAYLQGGQGNSFNQMTFGRPQQPMVQRIKARKVTKYVKTKIKGRTAYRKITKLIRSKARPIQVQQQPQSMANIDAMLRQQMGLSNPHPIIHSKKQKGDAVSQINKLMGL